MNEIILRTKNLKKYFKTKHGMLHAVDNIDLSIPSGKTLGVVGESGCGKSTLGRTVLRLHEPTSGDIWFKNENIIDYNKSQLRNMRHDMQIIFQDPYSSLNPRMTVKDLIAEPMIVNKTFKSRNEIYKRVDKLMETVGLAKRLRMTYPHELDGGRRQRIGVARSIALEPKFIVCDEPVSALDVSIQAQILNLLMDLQDDMGLTYMFITHDLSVVKHISDEIMVMYLGECVELAPSKELFNSPLHPYTKMLLSSIPIASIEGSKKVPQIIKGEVASPIEPGPGCRFEPRCPLATDECLQRVPYREITTNHFVACINYNKDF